MDLSLKSVLSCIRLFRSHHLHESEATALTSMWITHNVALLDHAVLLEQARDLIFRQTWVNTSDEEVGTRVVRAVVWAAFVLMTVAIVELVSYIKYEDAVGVHSPIRTSIHRLVTNAGITITVWAWRTRTLTCVDAIICSRGVSVKVSSR